jgi:outer membrane protein assembly factor BamB
MNVLTRFAVSLTCVAAVVALSGCAHPDPRRKPVELTAIKTVLNVQKSWEVSVGNGERYSFTPLALGDAVYAAAANGTVVKVDAKDGHVVWRTKLHDDLSAGAGSDGVVTAVAGLQGGVYVLDDSGKLLWKTTVQGEVFSPPLVGNGLVIVRTVDGQIVAFDAQTGAQKWIHRSQAMPLNLRVSAGMTFAGNAAVLVGFAGGELAALNVETGDAFWQTAVSYPKGVTEVERVNDVTGAPALVGAEVCAATYQGQLSCLDANAGHEAWTIPFSSASGVAQDDGVVAGADDWSVVHAFEASSGKELWKNDQLKNRALGVPYILGHAVVLGDYKGFVHFLSREDGTIVARMPTDGSAITAAPVLAGDTLVVQTHKGHLYGFRPS